MRGRILPVLAACLALLASPASGESLANDARATTAAALETDGRADAPAMPEAPGSNPIEPTERFGPPTARMSGALSERLEASGDPGRDPGTYRVIVSFHEWSVAALDDRGGLAAIQARTASLIARSEVSPGQFVPDESAQDALRVRQFSRIPAMALTVDRSQLETLRRLPQISYIEESIPARVPTPVPDDSDGGRHLPRPRMFAVPGAIGASESADFGGGLTGDGSAIAIFDTGVDAGHPFFASPVGGSRVVAGLCFSSNITASEWGGGWWVEGGGTSSTDLVYSSLCPGGEPEAEGVSAADDCDPSITGCGHGTSVAGVAAGSVARDFPLGPMSGIAPGAAIIAVQVFHRLHCDIADAMRIEAGYGPYCPDGRNDFITSSSEDRIAAVEAIIELHESGPLKVAAINMSLGGGEYDDACNAQGPAELAIAAEAVEAGIAVVAATGNDSLPHLITYPACLSSFVAVTSSVHDVDVEGIADYANNGAIVDLAAPGGGCATGWVDEATSGGVLRLDDCSFVFTAVPRGAGYSADTPLCSGLDAEGCERLRDYLAVKGTSIAAPVVAGAFAVLREARPDAPVAQLLSVLRSTGVNITDDRAWIEWRYALADRFGPDFRWPRYTQPRLDLEAAVRALLAASPSVPSPSALASVGVESGNGRLTAAWSGFDLPIVAQGRDVTRVEVRATPPAGRARSCSVRLSRGTLPGTCTITRLANDAVHTVEVRAQNRAGWSAWTDLTDIDGTITDADRTPVPVAPEPVGRLRAQTLAGAVRVTWAAPRADGGATPTYDVAISDDGGSTWVDVVTDTPLRTATITAGLDWGTGHRVRVRAGNSAGDSAWETTLTLTPYTTPDPAQASSVEVAPGNRALTASWAGLDLRIAARGAPVTRVEVRATPPAGRARSCSVRLSRGTLPGTCTITRLANDAVHTVEVRAQNRAGWSAWTDLTDIDGTITDADRTPLVAPPT